MRARVDLPQPDSPTTPSVSPRRDVDVTRPAPRGQPAFRLAEQRPPAAEDALGMSRSQQRAVIHSTASRGQRMDATHRAARRRTRSARSAPRGNRPRRAGSARQRRNPPAAR